MERLQIRLTFFLMICATIQCLADCNTFVLLTSLYNEKKPERIAEYLLCLEKNLANPLIESIHVFYDVIHDDENNQILTHLQDQQKISITYINGRPSFAMCFDFANEQLPNKNVVIANADIYFNETLKSLCLYDFTNKFLALTRWNLKADGSIAIYYWPDGRKAEYSQDAWFFSTPLQKFDDPNIFLGMPHCDGRIAYEAQKSGMQVINPCLSVQCVHVHLSGIKNYVGTPYPHGRAIKVIWSEL